MDNYAVARDRAREYFLQYDQTKIFLRAGVREEGAWFILRFLGADYRIERKTGRIEGSDDGFATVWEASFEEALSIYDRLCDGKPGARAADEFCPVHSLPGVLLGGSGGLTMNGGTLPVQIDKNPEAFRSAAEALGGAAIAMGDIGYRLQVFPDLPMLLKFYHSDEDFPAQLVFLWDRNTLDFVRYETVYYIAGCLISRLREKLGQAGTTEAGLRGV